MRARNLSIDPGICPACRSVQTTVVTEINGYQRVCQCRSCQKTYKQTFRPGANMAVQSPEVSTDMGGKVLWSSRPTRYDADGHEVKYEN